MTNKTCESTMGSTAHRVDMEQPSDRRFSALLSMPSTIVPATCSPPKTLSDLVDANRTSRVWKAATSNAGPWQQQDWTLKQQVRLREVSACRLLTAHSTSSVNTPHLFSRFIFSDTTAGNRCTSMPMASSVVCRLSTSRITSASSTAFHPAHISRTVHQHTPRCAPPACTHSHRSGAPHRGGGLREPQASLLSSRLQHLQHLHQQLLPQIRPPALRHRFHRNRMGSSPCVNVPPSARAGGCPRTQCCPRCVVGVPRRRAWEGRRRSINRWATTRRSPPCCCQLCTLWYCSHTPSQAPPRCKQPAVRRPHSSQPIHPSLPAPLSAAS
jgi:hypothetical protein